MSEKEIVVRWVKEEEWGYGKAMRVVESTHERFTKGTRFDFGFMSIATDEGYTIVSLPLEKEKCWCDYPELLRQSTINLVQYPSITNYWRISYCPICGRKLEDK